MNQPALEIFAGSRRESSGPVTATAMGDRFIRRGMEGPGIPPPPWAPQSGLIASVCSNSHYNQDLNNPGPNRLMPPSRIDAALFKILGSLLLAAGISAPLAAQAEVLALHKYQILRTSNAPSCEYPYIPEDLGPLVHLTTPVAKKMRAYAETALEAYTRKHGHVPVDDLQVAVAMADWVAVTMKHPSYYPVDPALPRYNPLHDANYNSISPDPLKMLEYTLRFDPADAENWPSPQCGHQNRVVIGLLNSMGIHGRLVALQLHTGLEFFSFRLHKWVYIDATHNEHYVLHDPEGGPGMPLNASEIHALTLARRLGAVDVVKHGYPGKDIVYLALQPQGFLRFAVPMFMKQYGAAGRAVGGNENYIMVSEDWLKPGVDQFWSPEDPNHEKTEPAWFALSGVRDSSLVNAALDSLGTVSAVVSDGTGVHFRLRSGLPYTAAFERYIPGSKAWVSEQSVPESRPTPTESLPIDLLPGTGTVRFRAVDDAGNSTQEFVIHVN